MKALVTGASSGIGRDIAIYLDNLGIELVLVSREKEKLDILQKELNVKVQKIITDLSNEDNCNKLYKKVRNDNIDILINCAGFGNLGEFYKTDLEKEIKMIDLNIKSVHILTKLFLKDFQKKDSGYILNVSSSAAFQPGPLMSTYYATKTYVLRLTTAIYEELRRDKSKVAVSVLCPGPVKTNFNKTANVDFNLRSIDSKYVAKYAIDKMFNKKLIIIPTLYMKTLVFFSRIIPLKLMLKLVYNIQNKKR